MPIIKKKINEKNEIDKKSPEQHKKRKVNTEKL